MAISIYLGGTDGLTDGTLEVPGDGVGIELEEIGSTAIFHFRASAGKQNAQVVTVAAPVDCEVSSDGNTFGATATYAAGAIKDTNTPCFVRRLDVTQTEARVEEKLSTTPHCVFVTIEDIPVPDSTSPVLTGALTATAGDGQVALDWPDATDNVAVTGYDIEYGTSTAYGTALTSAASAKTITGLTNATLYYFRARAYDAAGNKSAWLTATATPAAVPAGDTTAPAAPASITAYPSSGLVALDWPDATDNVAVTGYDIEYGTSTAYGTALTSTFSDKTITGLANGTTYYFRVRAYDAAGNKSAWVTTSATPSSSTDTTAPVLTGALTATAGDGQVALDWPDATDNVAVTGYDIEYGTSTAYGTALTSAASAKTITGLTNATLYYFRARAYDAAGNKSAWLTATATPSLLIDNFATLDTSVWTTAVTSPATLAANSGRLEGASTALSQNCYAQLKQTFAANSSHVYTVCGRPTADAVGQKMVYLNGLPFYTYLSFIGSNQISIAVQKTSGWVYYYTTGWLASGGTLPSFADLKTVDRQWIFETNATNGVRWICKSADGSTTHFTTAWIPWSELATVTTQTVALRIGQESDANWRSNFSVDWASVN